MRIRKIQKEELDSSQLVLLGTEVFRIKNQRENMILIELENKSVQFWASGIFFDVLDFTVLNQEEQKKAEEEMEKYIFCLLDTNFFRDADI